MTALPFTAIRMDGGTQSRVQLNWIVIDEYAKAMIAGDPFPPVIVYYDGVDYWLADGFHRVLACEKARIEINADVKQGTVRDAILFSVGANATHGLPRSLEDKRNAVMLLLNDKEWYDWSNYEIAEKCHVSHVQVSRLRPESIYYNVIDTVRTFQRNGKTHTMDTANIGKPKPKPKEQPKLVEEAPTVEPAPAPECKPSIVSNIIIHKSDAQEIYKYAVAPVHLVITSPPYNVGMDYGMTSDERLTYYELLTAVWRQCYEVIVDGGRICVNVLFGAGRNPWLPVMPFVVNTLVEAGFTIRGQIIWDKGTAGGKTAWGSFRLPTNPSLRDTTECVIIAHKKQSHLEIPDECRLKDDKGSHTAWLASSDYFLQLAQDHWVIPPESAQRIGHPAPFPVELVTRLIHFYAFPGAHILDPFAGSGTVGVAAKKLGCDATLFEINEAYCNAAKERIDGVG